MSPRFRDLVDADAGTRVVLQGNLAFALGCARSTISVANGYPGTPSTEVLDKGLMTVRDLMTVHWSVNEATAVASALGSAIAGADTVVTMKVPGLFQAADIVSTLAFYHETRGALVLYVATDFVPSSTQHVVDPRYFLHSCCLPIIEPRNHQDIYQAGGIAAEISREFHTPVVVLASGILCHSDGVVQLEAKSEPHMAELPADLRTHLLLPSISRANYNRARLERLPAISRWAGSSRLITETEGTDDLAIISYGMNEIVVKEALEHLPVNPSFLSVCLSNPLPFERIAEFAARHDNQVVVFEDGYRFVQDKLNQMGINARGKLRSSPNTDWTPDSVASYLTFSKTKPSDRRPDPPARPPNLCVGCPYVAFGQAVRRLKKKRKIDSVFGDIGCNTLLMFLDAIDTCACMGASESMRQGFVQARPELASKVLSVVGDSTEAHSGLDATRNAIYQGTPGVKVILDNSAAAMTGGQPSPTTDNLGGERLGQTHLPTVLRAEGADVIELDAYDMKGIETALRGALERAGEGAFTALVIKGPCIHDVPASDKLPQHQIDPDLCRACGLCSVCGGIEVDDAGIAHVGTQCTSCGGGAPVCEQFCKLDAFVEVDPSATASPPQRIATERLASVEPPSLDTLPETVRVEARGVGGQGILFLGKVLANLALTAGYGERNIIKGETHGMAQRGGSVSSTFGCGNAFSPVFRRGSVDALVALEASEVLRDGFIERLRPGGTIILNRAVIAPTTAPPDRVLSFDTIRASLSGLQVVVFDGPAITAALGDRAGRSTNVVALGVLSQIGPLAAFPEALWQQAIIASSDKAGAAVVEANLAAFEAGRELHG